VLELPVPITSSPDGTRRPAPGGSGRWPMQEPSIGAVKLVFKGAAGAASSQSSAGVASGFPIARHLGQNRRLANRCHDVW